MAQQFHYLSEVNLDEASAVCSVCGPTGLYIRNKRGAIKSQCLVKYQQDCTERQRRYRERHKEEIREREKARISANPEKRREVVKRYEKSHRAQLSEKGNKYYHANKEKINARRKELYDPEHAAALSKKSRQLHKQAIAVRKKAYYAKNRELCYEAGRRRRSLKIHQNCGCVPGTIKANLIEAYGNRCVYCEGLFEHVDHFVPLSRGGMHCVSNLLPACAPCNLSKSNKSADEWAGWNGFIPALQCELTN